MKISIQVKLFLLLVGLTVVILGGVLISLTGTLTEKIEEQTINDFQSTQYFFNQQQNLVYDRLVESCYLIGENSTFKANVALNDPASIDFSVNELSQFAKIDLFIVTDKNGKVLAWLDHPEKQGINLSTRAGVNQALIGIEPEVSIDWPELWAIDHELLQVVTLPVYAGDSIIGTISLGTKITRVEANMLKGKSNTDIHIFYNGNLLASTYPNSVSDSQKKSLELFPQEMKSLITSTMENKKASEAFSMKIGEDEVLAFMSPLGVGEPAYYLATVPKSTVLKILSVLQKNILLTAGISIILTIIIAFFLGKALTRPILNLVGGMNKVSDGDLSVSVASSSNDEIGLLTQSFNEMTKGLRERLHLMKYVGSHTIDMVKSSSGDEVSLGGSRKNLAVLFSDIRGFTAFSETRTAEEVIEMLNRILGFQSEIVNNYGGSIDKFVGDEMVALFTGDDSIEKAIQCALDIQKKLKEKIQSLQSDIYVGIGINYGSVIMGNMGAKERMDYTVIGAEVNLGARLCSKAKGGQILIPSTVLSRVNMDIKIKQVEKMSFKGISNELEIAVVESE